MSHTEIESMDLEKRTSTLQSITSGYEAISHEPIEFHAIELPFLQEEMMVLKAPNTYQTESYTAIELPETVESIEALPEIIENTKEPEMGIIQSIKSELTQMFQIGVKESDNTLPLVEVKKELV